MLTLIVKVILEDLHVSQTSLLLSDSTISTADVAELVVREVVAAGISPLEVPRGSGGKPDNTEVSISISTLGLY